MKSNGSAAALKAWETRRKEQEERERKLRKAARKAWNTRLADNPNSGADAAYKAWETRRKANPSSGTLAAIKAWETRRANEAK